jgi:hypothetical protein
VTIVGQAINRIFDLLVLPLAAVPAAAMVFLSLLTAVTALLIFKHTTNQQSLTVARDRLVGHIYEMGLYQDHLSQLAVIQGRLARANLRYLGLTVPALLALLVPMVIFVVQLESRFAHRPLAAGETTLLSVTLKEEHGQQVAGLELEAPEGITVEAGPVRSRTTGTVAWRLRFDDPAAGPLRILIDGAEAASRPVDQTGRLPRLSQTSATGWLAPILAPGVAPLPAGGVLETVTLQLPERQTTYLGLRLGWLPAFCVFSLLGGLLLKGALKVSL